MPTDSNHAGATDTVAAAVLTEADWLARLERAGDEAGFFEFLGANHLALFSDQSATLLVTFENALSIRAEAADALPRGQRIAAANGWSNLSVVSLGPTWFRDPALYAFFDRLVDEAFFEEFDRVIFFGAGMGGYGAAAYSVTAPGSTVVLVAPQATLDPDLAGWDTRFVRYRRLSFTDRYGFAPDMVEGAGPVFLAYDPREGLDAMHAALFARPFVHRLPCRGAGAGIATMFDILGLDEAMLQLAGDGRLTPAAFRRLWRARRAHQPYLRGLVNRLGDERRYWRAALVCRNVVDRLQAPRFAARLAQLETLLAADGRRLPGRRSRA